MATITQPAPAVTQASSPWLDDGSRPKSEPHRPVSPAAAAAAVAAAAAASPNKPDPVPYLKITSACFCFFIGGVNIGSVGALIPYIIRDYNVSTAIVSSV